VHTIKVKKDELLGKLVANRATHWAIFLDAQTGFREVVIHELDRRLKDARAGRIINIVFAMPAPVDQTGEYDRAIRMLEMSVDDIIELDEDDFSHFVLDEWHWKQQVHATNSMYTTRRP
jgi:hypothetical protein